MPSFRVKGPGVSFRRYDLVGQDGNQPHFISHTGLAETDVSSDVTEVSVLDMGPPLHGPGEANRIRADALGRAELNDDELQKIRTFVDQHAGEHASLRHLSTIQLLRRAPEMYCVYPHADRFTEADGRYVRMRFSCAGFAFEAYKLARITLLNPNELPTVDLGIIRTAYPRQSRLLDSGKLTPESLGLTGTGPWPVLLCGYLFHAIARHADTLRKELYNPSPKDRYFTQEAAES